MNTPVKTVSCRFQNDINKDKPRDYTYLVPPSLTPLPGQMAVVSVRDRFECVLIISLNPPLDPNAKFEYKEIIDLVEDHRTK